MPRQLSNDDPPGYLSLPSLDFILLRTASSPRLQKREDEDIREFLPSISRISALPLT